MSKIFDTTKIDIVSKSVGVIKSLIPEESADGDEKQLLDLLADYVGSANSMESLVKAFDTDGAAGLQAHLIAIAADIAVKNELSVDFPKIKQKLEFMPFEEICGESMSDVLKFTDKSITLEKEIMDIINTSNDYGIKMTAIHAQRECALEYIDEVISYLETHPQKHGRRILDACRQVRKEVDNDFNEYMSSFTYEACQLAGKYGVKALTGKIIPKLLEEADKRAVEEMKSHFLIPGNLTPGTMSWASAFKTGFTIAKTTFTTMYAILGTKKYVELRELMNVDYVAINTSIDRIRKTILTDPETAWLELKYLIQLRIESETAYFTALKKDVKKDTDEEFLSNYNELNGTAYESIDDFLKDYIGGIQQMSDQLSSDVDDQTSSGIVRPEAPAVSVDFIAETTMESFDEAYEYSFDNISWTSCSGGPIALFPERYSKILYVRAKATETNLEGYSAVLYIPAKRTVQINCRAVWNDGVLYLTNLSKGKYRVEEDQVITVENGRDDIIALPTDHIERVTLQMISETVEFSGYASSINVMGPADISVYDQQAYLDHSDFSYDGTEKRPELLFKGSVPTDLTFEASYTDNVEAGTAEAVFRGTGLYAGMITRQFVIVGPAEIIRPKKLALNKTEVRLTARNEASEDQVSVITLEPVFTPKTTNIRNLEWTSSDPAVAFVADGTVTALSAGKAVITAEAENGIKAVCKVTVIHGEGLASDGKYYDSKGKLMSGWKKVTVSGNEEILYLTKGKPAVGWKKINKKYYYFTEDGFLMTGWINDRESRLDTEPDPKKNKGLLKGWQQADGNWYYFDTNGIKVTGLAKISGQYYYFSESADPELSGIMQEGWQHVGGEACYFAENAKNKHPFRRTGWQDCPDPETGEIRRYYFSTVSGGMATGLVKIGGKLYFFDESGHLAEEASLQSPEGDYHLDEKGRVADEAGKLAEGLVEINGNTYFFKKGITQTGWQKIIDETQKAVYYFFNPDGTLEKGKTGGDIISDGKKTWFIEESGIRSVETGLVQDGEGHTYAIKNGQILYGQQKVQISSGDTAVSNYYWFDTETGWMCTNVLRYVKGKWYFYGADGVRSQEPLTVEINGEDHLLDQNGKITDLSGNLLNKTGPAWIRYTVSDTAGEVSDVFELFYLKKGVLSVKWQSYKVADAVTGNRKKTYTTYKFYCDPETGILHRGITTVAKKQYYFSERDRDSRPAGSVVYGFFRLRGKDGNTYTYWADKSGVLAKGWVLIDKIWYCFDSADGHLTEIRN